MSNRKNKKNLRTLLVIVLTILSCTSLVYASNGKGNGNKNELYEFKVNSGNNGSISIDTGYYEKGEEINFNIMPEEGYVTNNVNVTKGELIENSKNNFTYTMPAEKVVLSVSFKKDLKSIDFEKDTDKDGIPDYFEKEYFNTDPKKADTDEDGLTDYEEVYLTGTNPLKQDTDDNGILDIDEDTDGDGLSNIEEIKLGTFSFEVDSDVDGLTDYDEVKNYKTNPLNQDTDNDGLNDSKDIELGFDPNNKDTDGNGILDGNERFDLEFNFDEEFENSTVVPNLDIELEAHQLDSLDVNEASEEDIYTSEDIPGFIGNAYDFKMEDDIESGTLTFSYSPKLRIDSGDELAIYEVDKVNQKMILLPNQIVDKVNHTVSAPIDSLSQKTYMLLNKTEFDEEFMLKLEVSNIGAALDIVFAIDSSGSMTNNDPKGIRKSVTKDFIDILDEDDRVGVVDFDSSARIYSPLTTDKEAAKAAVDKIDSRGGTNFSAAMSTSINVHANAQNKSTRNDIYRELELLSSQEDDIIIDEVTAGDGVYDDNLTSGTSIRFFDEEMTSSSSIESYNEEIDEEVERLKYIILLTDGQGSYNTAYTTMARDRGIKVYTVGLGNSVNTNLLRGISNGTGGKYFHADDAESLINEFASMQEVIVDLTTDTDEDGLSDYHERYLRLFNGVYLGTDPESKDTDGDGISDYDELEEVYNFNEDESDTERQVIEYYEMKSNPTKKDTDKDGLTDNVDLSPRIYDVTGKTLANVADLSYLNLENYVGMTVGEMYNSGASYDEAKELDYYVETLEDAEIIYANDSGNGIFFGDIADRGLGSIALRIPNLENDIIIYGLRGTEPSSDILDDFITDIILGIGPSSAQSDIAYYQYGNIQDKDADMYITGHSLGGRLTLDVLYKIYDREEDGFKKPTYATTFNGLGYMGGSLAFIDWGVSFESGRNLSNYYIRGDLVGNWLGDSLFYTKPGKQIELEHEESDIVSPFGLHDMAYFVTGEGLIDKFTYESTLNFN